VFFDIKVRPTFQATFPIANLMIVASLPPTYVNKYERTLLSRLMQAKNMFCVDSKPIPMCRFVLANHYKLEKTILPWHRFSDIMHRKIVTSLATNCMHYVVLLV
jgi:hypothetical protein